MSEKIYKVTLFFAGLGLLFSIIGMLVPASYIGGFIWLVFYMPVLWMLWILCVLLARDNNFFIKLILAWGVIDISILFFFIMLSMEVPNWANSKGIEMVLGTVYLPVIVPTGFLVYFLPINASLISNSMEKILISLFGEVIGGPLGLWIWMSVIAAIQSLGLMGCVYVWKIRNRKQVI